MDIAKTYTESGFNEEVNINIRAYTDYKENYKSLVLEAIVKAEKLDVTDKDIEDKYNEGKEKKKTIAEIRKELKGEQVSYLENNILMNKLLKMLKDNNNL